MSFSLTLVPIETSDPRIEEPVLIEREVTLGRSPDCDLSISDNALSRFHCKIAFQGSGFIIEDLKSRNGTVVNKKKITSPVDLNNGDEIVVGKSVFQVEIKQHDTTVAYDSVSFSEQEKDSTNLHDSQQLAEDFSGPSPISMELDRRLIDDYLKDDYKSTQGRGPV